jgi:hypothetical protein
MIGGMILLVVATGVRAGISLSNHWIIAGRWWLRRTTRLDQIAYSLTPNAE